MEDDASAVHDWDEDTQPDDTLAAFSRDVQARRADAASVPAAQDPQVERAAPPRGS